MRCRAIQSRITCLPTSLNAPCFVLQVVGFDKERFDTRVHKIEDNLFSHQPQLAQLIQLNSIGVDLLVREKEKQLRFVLEPLLLDIVQFKMTFCFLTLWHY